MNKNFSAILNPIIRLPRNTYKYKNDDSRYKQLIINTALSQGKNRIP